MIKFRKTTQTNSEEIKRVLEQQGYKTYPWSDPPGTYYPEHTHEDWEVRWVVAGEVTIGTKEKIYHLEPGDYIELPPQTPHWAKTETGVEYICGSKPE